MKEYPVNQMGAAVSAAQKYLELAESLARLLTQQEMCRLLEEQEQAELQEWFRRSVALTLRCLSVGWESILEAADREE